MRLRATENETFYDVLRSEYYMPEKASVRSLK